LLIVRLAQCNAFTQSDIRLSLTESFISAKIHNHRKLMERCQRLNPSEFEKQSTFMKACSSNLRSAKNIDEAMGTEGFCAKTYWPFFGNALKEPLFLRREYRPACDAANSALNLGCAFLANEIASVLTLEQFDTEIGFLHSIRCIRNSLALDLTEEFR
jgi:CRISPR-associated endonuclease Cas1